MATAMEESSDSSSAREESGGSWAGHDVVTVTAFRPEGLRTLFAAADKCKAAVKREDGFDPRVLECCKGKILANVFYEPSTRTSCSFAAAMLRLGGQVLSVDAQSSSAKKGETLQDTMRCLECYSDVMVLRHPDKGSVSQVSSFLSKPIINAGDGAGEHPTQALLDLFTIMRERGGELGGNLTITMLGDLKYGRTTHSLAVLLARYQVTINYVTPTGLEMPEEVRSAVAAVGVAKQHSCSDILDVLAATDVLYVTRVQKERFASMEEYAKVQGSFVVDADLLQKAASTLTIMHPLPRVGEITEEVDSFPGAAYFRQMENGMFVRMAILANVLGVMP